MARELVYTSVPKGLFPGTMGFCVVACSRGLSEMETSALEKLSGYRRTVEADGGTSVVYSHLLVENGSRTLRVLSRIADAEVDYSGRDNKIASHLLLDADDLIAAGPARLCSLSNLFYGRWIDAPRFFEAPRKLPSLGDPPNERPEWFRQTGDRGWAGALVPATPAPFPRRFPIRRRVGPLNRVVRRVATGRPKSLARKTRRWRARFGRWFGIARKRPRRRRLSFGIETRSEGVAL